MVTDRSFRVWRTVVPLTIYDTFLVEEVDYQGTLVFTYIPISRDFVKNGCNLSVTNLNVLDRPPYSTTCV